MEFDILLKHFIFNNVFIQNHFVLCPKIVLPLEYMVFGGNLHNYSRKLPYSW